MTIYLKKEKKIEEEKKETREIKPKILIVCEGEKTEQYTLVLVSVCLEKIEYLKAN